MMWRPSSFRMKALIVIVFSLYHSSVAQVGDGAHGSHSEYPEYSCSPQILSELKEAKTMLTEQKAVLDEVKKQTGNLCHPDIQSELKELKATVAEQQVKLAELQKQIADQPKVAFSASLFGLGGKTIGGHSSEIVLKFEKVFTNVGSAYNPATGMFTAPVRGVYYFGFSAFANEQYSVGVHLRKNGHNIVATYDYNKNHKDVNGANRALLLLEKGDQVNIGLWSGLYIFDSYNCVSTFSGFLLYLM